MSSQISNRTEAVSGAQPTDGCLCRYIGPEAAWVLPLYRRQIMCPCVLAGGQLDYAIPAKPSKNQNKGITESKNMGPSSHAPDPSPNSSFGTVLARSLHELLNTPSPAPQRPHMDAALASRDHIPQAVTQLLQPETAPSQQLVFVNCPSVTLHFTAPIHNNPQNSSTDNSLGNSYINKGSGPMDVRTHHGARVLSDS